MKLGDGSWQMGVATARGKRLPSWSAVAVTPLLRTGSRLKMTGTLRTFQTRLQSGVAPRFPPHSKIWRRYGWFMEGDIPPECPRPDGWASRSYPQLLLLEAENPKNSIFRTKLTSGWVKPDPKKAEFEVNRVEAEAKSPEAVVKRAGFDAKKVESDAKRFETGLISVETDLKARTQGKKGRDRGRKGRSRGKKKRWTSVVRLLQRLLFGRRDDESQVSPAFERRIRDFLRRLLHFNRSLATISFSL